MATLEKIDYHGWPNCYRFSNPLVDLIVTTDVGPRIIRFGFVGEVNEFYENPATLGKVGGSEWCNYGGHRLWHAPEAIPRTYFPDNSPVKLEEHTGFIRLIQPVESTTGIQKEMDITLQPDAAWVQVTHRLCNNSPWMVELAAWGLSVMAPGGIAIIPLPPRGAHQDHLQPVNTLTLWAYTDMTDPRWTWGQRYILLRQDTHRTEPQKTGMMNLDGWVAYARGGHLFVKTFTYLPGKTYPDFGCSIEVFTNQAMLEVESLGPLTRLEPGESVEHVEHWYLFRDIPQPTSEAEVETWITPFVIKNLTGLNVIFGRHKPWSKI